MADPAAPTSSPGGGSDRWVTVHPLGRKAQPTTAEERGYPVQLDEHNEVKAGLGGLFNGHHASHLHVAMGYGGEKAREQFTAFEGAQQPQNLTFARHTYTPAQQPRTSAQARAAQQVHQTRQAHFARWGPEFHIQHEEPEHQEGYWQARLYNPHLENAVRAGQARTPSGADLMLHPEGGVVYRGITPTKTWRGYQHFATGMGRDAVAHIANYLAGATQPQMPAGFMKGVQWRRPQTRPTEAEQAPTSQAPWGHNAGGGKRLPTALPIDPLADPQWAPRPDILAQGQAPPETRPVSQEPPEPPVPRWMTPLEGLRRAFAPRAQPRDPTITSVPPATAAPPVGPPVAPSPTTSPSAVPAQGEVPESAVPAAPAQEPGAELKAPDAELKALHKEWDQASWAGGPLIDTAREEGRGLTPQEEEHLSGAYQTIEESERRAQDLIRQQGWTRADLSQILGEEPPTGFVPAEHQAPAAELPEEPPPLTSAEGSAPPPAVTPPVSEVPAQAEQPPQTEQPSLPTPPESGAPAVPPEPESVPQPEPSAFERTFGSLADDLARESPEERTARVTGGVLTLPSAKTGGAPDEKSGGVASSEEPSDGDDGWARWEAEQQEQASGRRADLEREAEELGVSPAELEAYYRDQGREEDPETGQHGHLDWANRLVSAVRDRGGVRGSGYGASEYAELPIAVKNRHSHHTLDTLFHDLQESHPEFGLMDTSALHDALVRAAQIQQTHGLKPYGAGKRVKSRFAHVRDKERANQERREVRALVKQGWAPPVRRKTREAGGEPMEQGPDVLTPDDYAVPSRRLLPLHTRLDARRSWDLMDRTPDLSPAEREEAEQRILDALHAYGLPEHEPAPEHEAAELGDGEDGMVQTGSPARVEAGAETDEDEDQQMGKQRIPPAVAAEAEREGETPEHEMAEKESGTEYGPADLKEDRARAEAEGEEWDYDDDDEDGEYGDDDEEEEPARAGVREAALATDAREDLGDAKFACPELRKLPIHDAAHVRNAMARFNQTQGLSAEQKKAAWHRITHAAKKFGVGVSPEQKQNNEDVRESGAEAPVSIPSRIPVQFMSVGHGNKKDGHFYTEDAVRNLVDCVRTQPKMFISHSDQTQVQRHGHRPLEQLGAVAVRESVHYDPVRRACVGEVVLRPAMREYVETAHAAGDTIGISVDGKGLFRPGTRECVGWSQFYSADFVPRGGAGGFTLAVRESERPDLVDQEKEFVLMSLLSSLTTAEVREGNPDLFESIGRAYAEAHPVTETVREADTAEVERLVRENESLTGERDQALVRLDELEAERNREQVARFVDQLVRECGVDQAQQVAYVAKLFAGATCGARGTYQTREELEGAVRETAQEYLATLPKSAPSGEIVGQGAARSEAVREGAGYNNPLQIANEGMALLWGHKPEAKSANGASA